MPVRLLTETVGTFAIAIAAIGVDVSYFTGSGADFASRWLTRAFVTAAAIFAFSDLSGAHLSPAVTFGFALRGVFRWLDALAYAAAQFLGAILAAVAAMAAYGSLVSFGASHPGPSVSPWLAAGCEAVLTCIVMLVILCTAEKKPAVGKDAALAVGFAVGACGFFGGPLSGASMNPARSIAPQLLTGQFGLMWIYVAGPLLGAALAVALQYLLCGPPSEAERAAARGR